MSYGDVITSKTNKAKCRRCKEPILRKEGVMEAHNKGYWCYKCSRNIIIGWVTQYKIKLNKLEKENHIGEKRMNELKIVKMI